MLSAGFLLSIVGPGSEPLSCSNFELRRRKMGAIEMPPASTLRVSGWLIYVFYVFSVFTLMTGAPAFARVLITVDKSTQQMSVSVDGVPRYRFAVSTGRAGYGTPNGTYHPQRLAASWFSKLYYNSPMPHSIFFLGGYAIHGSYEINRLGGPASHGCIRLHPANAAALFELVKSEGTGATSIVVSGSNPVIARSHVPSQRPHDRRWKPSRDDRYSPNGEPSDNYSRPEPSNYSY